MGGGLSSCRSASGQADETIATKAGGTKAGRMCRTDRRTAAFVGLLAWAMLAQPLPGGAAPPEPGREDPEAVRAVALSETGRYDLSVPILEAVLARLPGDPDILTYLAFALRRTGRLAEAEARYDEALAQDPDHLAAIAYQGVLFLQTGRRDGAQANLRRLEALCPIGCTAREDLAREVAARG